jgi:site-specific recombinase XerD
METYKDIAVCIEKYFTDYLVKERGVSAHTMRSYRDTFILLLEYMNEEKRIPADKLGLDDIDKNTVLSFLDWLQYVKHNAVSTRNQRCATIRSFYEYLMYEDPIHMSRWKSICSIRIKREIKHSVKYLTVDGIKAILEQIDTNTREGRRNLTLLSLMYNLGARVQEMINLTPLSIRANKPYVIELFGKGAKKRLVPIDGNMMHLLENYLKEYGLDRPGMEHHPLFFNSRRAKLTNPGITYILQKYASMARMKHPDIVPVMPTPHTFRHSRAMHLLQAGVNLVYIRDLLGHVSIQTTEIYARADSKLKREAIENAYSDLGVTEPDVKSWEKDPKLKAFLKNLA